MLNKFEEVQILLDRADEHLAWLKDWVVHPEKDLIPANEGYNVLPQSFDRIAGKIRIVIGEHAGCLRKALNYLTVAVAEQDLGSIGQFVQLPIESTRKSFATNRERYLKGVADEHLAFFEALQPYNASDPSWLARLRDLTNWNRDNGLIRVEKVFQRPRVATLPTQTERYGGTTMEVRRDISFGVTLEGDLPVIQTLEKLKIRTAETIDRFKAPLARYVSLHIEDSP